MEEVIIPKNSPAESLTSTSVQARIFYDTSEAEIKITFEVLSQQTKKSISKQNGVLTREKSLQDFIALLYELRYEKFHILTNLNRVIDFYHESDFDEEEALASENISSLEAPINQFLAELCSREDLLYSLRVLTFFGLEKSLRLGSLLPPKFVQKFYSSIVEEEIYIAGLDLNYDQGVCLLFLSCSGPTSNFGRIWSLLQKTYLGAFDIYRIDRKDSVLPEFKKIFSTATEEKITSACYLPTTVDHKFYLSMHSGKMLIYSFTPNFKSKKMKAFYMLKQPINKLISDPDSEKIVVVGESSVKVFNSKSSNP